jgi:hypothetical protein
MKAVNDVVNDNQIVLTVKQFCATHKAFTIGGVRSLIFNEFNNGINTAGAVLRIGGKVLIHQERFFMWVDLQNGGLR